MDYQIVLSPDLGLGAVDFADAWNETEECRSAGEARTGEPTAAQYDPALIGSTLAVLGSVAAGVTINAIYDLIKSVLVKKGVQKRTEIKQLDQPDGSRLLIVTITEE